MNDQEIIKNMIEFIENKEHQLQINKLSMNTQVKNDIVKAILDKLESEISDEN